MPGVLHPALAAVVMALSAYSVVKFAFFFVLPYDRRRAALDRAYGGLAYATGRSDLVMLVLATALAIFLLGSGSDPIAFLGGLFVGAVLIQMFFHAFHKAPALGREAPEPRSPLKQLSYAIQDRPGQAWKQMAIYTLIVAAGIGLYIEH